MFKGRIVKFTEWEAKESLLASLLKKLNLLEAQSVSRKPEAEAVFENVLVQSLHLNPGDVASYDWNSPQLTCFQIPGKN